MALTDKGSNALKLAREFYPNSTFTAADLSAKSGQFIYAATLNAIVNNGFMNKLEGNPAVYKLVDNIDSMAAKEHNGNDNSSLRAAQKAKNDEFYTQFADVEAECINYIKHFRDKKILLNCNDTENSNFWKYFYLNFNKFNLKSLTAIGYNASGGAQLITTTNGATIERKTLAGSGSFSSTESLELLADSDLVVTNPPFSLFRDYMAILMKYEKQFLIIGNQNAFTYKEIFPLIKNDKVWPGINAVHNFTQPDGSIKKFGNICWFTNLPNGARTEPIPLAASYSAEKYPKYDNYNAVEVSKVADIPSDYYGVMGVPITFINKYCPTQFEIVGQSRKDDTGSDGGYWECGRADAELNGKQVYRRVLIRRRKR